MSIKTLYEKLTANITLNGEKQSFSLRLGIRQGCPFWPLYSTQYWKSQGQHKETKGIQIGKKEVKLSLFADDMILYIENLKDSTKKTTRTDK